MKTIKDKLRTVIISTATCLGILCATPFRSYAPPPVCTNTVQNTLDSGPGTLRDALANAADGETITFCPGVTGTITLTNGALLVANSVTILGPGPDNLAVGRGSGSPFSGIFYVASNHIVTIAGLAITNGNVGGTFGGGIYNDHSTLTVSNCFLNGNSAAGGGGIYNDGANSRNATLTIIASTISSNPAFETGGGIYNDALSGNATLTVIASTFSQNSSGNGGAIYSRGSLTNMMVTIYNSTFSSNTAPGGGGAFFFQGPGVPPSDDVIPLTGAVTIENSTLNGNSGGAGGGDSIYNNGSTVVIASTILNVRSAGTNIYNTGMGSVGSLGYNLSSDSGSGFLNLFGDQTNTAPLLGPLQDNGGPTFTHAPLCGSPAIDKGRDISGSTTDQRGAARKVDLAEFANAPFGDGTDVGAVETPIWLFTVQNTNDSGAGSLRQAILDANASAGLDMIQFAPSAYGTITLTSGELAISDCLLLNGPGATNVAVNGNAASRVFNIGSGTEVTIAGLTIANGAALDGGGILNDHAMLTISNCTLSGNTAGGGGGISSEGTEGSAKLTVVNSTFSGNSASGGGGGILNIAISGGIGTLTVVNSTFSGNSATNDNGGAIFNRGSDEGNAPLTVVNSTFSGNSAPRGGGIYNDGGAGNAIVQIGSSIWANSATISSANFFTTTPLTIASLGYNLSSDNGGGFLNQPTDQTNTSPLLGPLQLNGGETPTHALLCGSPAIDAGTNFLVLLTDQRGFARTVNDPGVANVADGTDIGAFEAQTPPTCNQPPVVLCTNVTVSAGTNCMADASIDNGSYDPDAGDSITNRVQSPAGPYPLGTNAVVLTVTDNHGATNSCTGMVIVLDTTPPVIHCPTNIVTTNDVGQCSAAVNYTVSADDNCSSVTLSEDYPSGSMFSTGTNTVTVTGVDLAGNTNTCTFTVTVLDQEAPLVMCRPAPNPSGKISEPGKNGSINPNGYYQLLAKDNCDANPAIYVKDTKSGFVAGPFKDGDIVRLKHAGAAASSVSGSAPVVAIISLKGNGLAVAQDAGGNRTPDASGCVLAVSGK